MMGLILDFVTQDDNIRAAVINGSRVDPNGKKDIFQDYDIACFVRSVEPYVSDRAFLSRFGELMIMQIPEYMTDPPPKNDGHHGYLMQFQDGNRIDLGFRPMEALPEATNDSLTIVLVDKDGALKDLPPPSDRDYLPEEPTAKAFDDCCNEFWWVCPYAAKGLWRHELTYARGMMDDLEPSLASKLESTYADSDFENMWDALFAMGDLFRETAIHVAHTFGYVYPERDDENVSRHLRHVRQLPRDAEGIY